MEIQLVQEVPRCDVKDKNTVIYNYDYDLHVC